MTVSTVADIGEAGTSKSPSSQSLSFFFSVSLSVATVDQLAAHSSVGMFLPSAPNFSSYSPALSFKSPLQTKRKFGQFLAGYEARKSKQARNLFSKFKRLFWLVSFSLVCLARVRQLKFIKAE